ncbi:hypothetical protein [Microcystis phage vB_MaeS-yong1]|nr:hypothetical protein [Microcystis phage vB_MaeS-yong1]
MSRCSERRLAIELAQEKARVAMLGSSEHLPSSSEHLAAGTAHSPPAGDWGRWFREPLALAAPAALPTATPPTARPRPRPWWRRLLGLAHR